MIIFLKNELLKWQGGVRGPCILGALGPATWGSGPEIEGNMRTVNQVGRHQVRASSHTQGV